MMMCSSSRRRTEEDYAWGGVARFESGHTHNVSVRPLPLLQRILLRDIVFVPFYVRPIMDDFETQGALYKRKDFLDKEEGAKTTLIELTISEKNVDVEKLIESCTRKLAEDPENAKALLIRASSYVKKQQYEAAVNDYTRAIALSPNDETTFYNRGTSYEKLGALDEAINDFTMVLNIDPNHVNAAYARAACHNRKGLFSEAIDDYNFALMKDEEARLSAAAEAQKNFGDSGTSVTQIPIPHSPGRKRTGSFAIGVDKYTKKREQELRKQIAADTPPQSPSRRRKGEGSGHPIPAHSQQMKSAYANIKMKSFLHSPPRSPANFNKYDPSGRSKVFNRNAHLNVNASGRSTPADVIPAPSSPSIITTPPISTTKDDRAQYINAQQISLPTPTECKAVKDKPAMLLLSKVPVVANLIRP